MTRTMLSSLAAAAALAVVATQWGGVAAAAKNTKPTEIVVVPYKGAAPAKRKEQWIIDWTKSQEIKGATASRRKKSIKLEPSFQGGTRVSPSGPPSRRRLRAR